MKPVNFKPRWMQSLSPEDRVILANAPTLGDLPTEPPQVCTRILPRDHSCRLSAKTVSEAIDLTQNLVNYAGHDVYHGLNPDFADLCLVRMSELYPKHSVITVDRTDFEIYRRNKRESIPLLCPPAR